jgi:hypothetical protein
MSGVLVPFETREARTARLAATVALADLVETAPPTPEELFTRYEQHTLVVCRGLLKHYRQTQRWTPSCEQEMAIAVTSLKNVCRLLAATTPEVLV